MKSCGSDVIQCELLWSGFLLKKRFGRPLVLVDRNVEYLKFRQMGRVLYSNFVGKLEKVGCERADRIVVVSEVDKASLMRLYGLPEEKIRVIRNCADPDIFKFSEEGRSFVRNMYGVGAETMVLTFWTQQRNYFLDMTVSKTSMTFEKDLGKDRLSNSKSWPFKALRTYKDAR